MQSHEKAKMIPTRSASPDPCLDQHQPTQRYKENRRPLLPTAKTWLRVFLSFSS